MKRFVVALFAVGAAVVVPAIAASAHPLGNFTVNQYSGLHIGADAVTIDLVTDEAEIPTVQARSAIDANHDGNLDANETARWQGEQCNAAASNTTLKLDGQPVVVHAAAGAGALTFPPGQAGLVTLRLECELRAEASIGAGRHDVDYRNSAFHDRIGWHEIVAAADGATVVSSDVATTSVTQRLTSYPTDQLRSPLNQRAASVTFNVDGGGAAATPRAVPNTRAVTGLLPRGADRASRAFTSLVARHDLTLAFALAALGIALGLGSLHALAPGHGKTVMAAYIVGQRGSLRQAALIGLTVTATHTAGVLALGIVLTTSNALAPERLYPWLGILSGLLLASIGVTLARRAWRIRRMHAAAALAAVTAAAHDHDHDHDHDDRDHGRDHDHGHHAHDDHDHDHGAHDDHNHGHGAHHDHDHDHRHGHDHPHHGDGHHDHDHHDDAHGHDHDHGDDRDHELEGALAHSHGGWVHSHPTFDESIGWRSLVAVGFAGGLVPSPSALLVLVGAIALGRTWFGLALVIAYGVGMAVMLTGAGLVLVRARRLFERRALRGRRSARLAVISRLVPLATSTVIITVGLALAARSAGKI
jgi:nickel/cobalt transporter (NicO) family protein